jgi:zinc transporter 1/2/3
LIAKDIGTVKVLLIGLGLHQFFEGFGLGTALLEGKISSKYQYIFGIVFASTAPIGIILGMYATNSETDNIVAGYADAFASGTLIYTSVVDMIAEDYMDNNFKDRHIGKTLMFFSLTLGVTVMAIIAIWA